MLGNIMQQLYKLADTWIVGRHIGDNALATVDSSYTLITFLTSVIIGLSLSKGLCYIGIGILFMLYGYYRAVNKPLMSVILTILSLGTRVLLAYILSPVPAFGVMGIWIAISIGWFIADAVGTGYYMISEKMHSITINSEKCVNLLCRLFYPVIAVLRLTGFEYSSII